MIKFTPKNMINKLKSTSANHFFYNHQNPNLENAFKCRTRIYSTNQTQSKYTFLLISLMSYNYVLKLCNLLCTAIFYHALIPPLLFTVFVFWFESRSVSSDRFFLLRTLPASFSSSASLFFSSSTSGFAVPSFSSLIPTINSRISIASSSLCNKVANFSSILKMTTRYN